MNLASKLQAIEPQTRASPLQGFEYVRGYGVHSLPFDSGHVLALRVLPENDFAPYISIWHRTPDGLWSIFISGPRLDTACPRYFGAAAHHVQFSNIILTWTGPRDLLIEMDSPKLVWSVSMKTTKLIRVMNVMSARMPERLWRSSTMLRAMERIAGALFNLGDMTLSGILPNGHFGILMPKRMFFIESATANLDGEDLGEPTRIEENPSIGDLKLPARPIFAIGKGYFEIQDPIEYQRTIEEIGIIKKK